MKSNKETFLEFYDGEEYENAVKYFELNINDSNDVELKFFYALALFKMQNYLKSTKIYKELLLLEEKPEIFFNITINQILNGNIDEGISTYNLLVEFCKKNDLNYISYKIYITHALIDKLDKKYSKEFISELSKEMRPFQEMDVHFLYVRQLPFYSDYLHCIKRYLDILPKEEAKLEVKRLSENLNRANYETLNRYSIESLGESLTNYEDFKKNQRSKSNTQDVKPMKGCLFWIVALVMLLPLTIWKCTQKILQFSNSD